MSNRDLVDFLRARLDEDEQVARNAGGRTAGTQWWVPGESNADGVRTASGTPVTKFSWPHEMTHIARHDPARVLAEVAAKRAVIEALGREDASLTPGLQEAVERLALVYADHPDYRPDWSP